MYSYIPPLPSSSSTSHQEPYLYVGKEGGVGRLPPVNSASSSRRRRRREDEEEEEEKARGLSGVTCQCLPEGSVGSCRPR